MDGGGGGGRKAKKLTFVAVELGDIQVQKRIGHVLGHARIRQHHDSLVVLQKVPQSVVVFVYSLLVYGAVKRRIQLLQKIVEARGERLV